MHNVGNGSGSDVLAAYDFSRKHHRKPADCTTRLRIWIRRRKTLLFWVISTFKGKPEISVIMLDISGLDKLCNLCVRLKIVKILPCSFRFEKKILAVSV